ncbi:ESPR-type extended signal peptide-containing protein [Acinetobacter parvus]|uniref:ESPR-type extended signal peptide-containing protein n=2 Tax=Acinetobacter TaxID=469 RepID=UPI0021D07C28|nr:ESPR-type extended signal peptide-containing protein [Acinetobacter parvus]MCU4394194.1 hypothetical protein [Acinetobacter parvus]
MNHIFKKIWNKSLGRMIVVSENAKSAGKTDNTTGIQQNSLSNVQCDEQGKSGVFSFKPFVLQSLALSVAMILGGNTQADDNYAHTTTDTALGSAKGSAHTATTTAGKITAVGGITVTTTGAGTNLNHIDSFTVNGVKTTNPTAVAEFINAAKKGGNIAVGSYSSAVGTANIASGSSSSAVGFNNNASSHYSSAVGTLNFAKGQYSTAMGMENYTQNQSSAAVGTRKIPNQALTPFVTGGVITSVNGIAVTATGSSLNDITHINGTAVNATELNAFLEHLIWGGNLALADESSVFGVGGITTGNRSTAIGYDSLADEANTISVGRAGAEKRITNVATPTKATDAANKGYVDTKFASVTGGTVASDNYARSTTDTAIGSARGVAHTTTLTAGKITAVGGITVTTTGAGTSLDDIDSFTANGVTTTKAANPTAVAEFINAAKKGGNIAVGSYSSAVGTANIASGFSSSAVGFNNNASGYYSSAVGYMNTASGSNSSAVGYVNIASGWYSSAVGYRNEASGLGSNAVGGNNLAKSQASNAFGITNTVDHGASNTNPFISDNSIGLTHCYL